MPPSPSARQSDLARVQRLLHEEREHLARLAQAAASGADVRAEIAAVRLHLDALKELSEAVRERVLLDQAEAAQADFRRTDYSVLVVDDHDASRYSISRALRAKGYQTMEASAGAQALELAQYASALVLDVALPDLHGFEVCRLVRNAPHTQAMPIVHVSAVHRSYADYASSREAGADDFMVSPVDFPLLTERLDSLLFERAARA